MKNLSAPTTLLQAVCLYTAAFGAVMVLAPGFTRSGFGWLLLGGSAAMQAWPEQARNYVTLVHGVLGAVLVGWGVGLLLLVRTLWPLAPRVAWRAVALSVLCWWLPDTSFSLAVGAWQNALLNLGFGLLFAAGLWRARSAVAG
jgi:hypothetical protein